jgi:hypothetical protein
MKLHGNARTAYRWLARWREEGEAGLLDRSSAPGSIPHRTAPGRVEVIEQLRRLFMTAAEIAEVLGMALSTVLKRIGLGKRSRLAPAEPPNRYERKRPGELVHLDIKKLGRIAGAGHRVLGTRSSQNKQRRLNRRSGGLGWEFVHVAVDDATRLAYAEVLPNEQGPTAVGFLDRAIAWFGSLGITVERIPPITVPATAPTLTLWPAASTGSATSSPAPTDPALTAKQSDSSKPSSTAGPAAPSTAAQPNAPQPSQAG